MRWRFLSSEERLRIATIAILTLGFAAAIVIFLIAQEPGETPYGYDALATKKYVHDLEVYGGRANVIAAQFSEWFDSLWHGRQLAFTVAALTVLTVLVYRFIATLPSPDDEDEEDANHRRHAGPNVAPFDRHSHRK
jgi:hypothetical protein